MVVADAQGVKSGDRANLSGNRTGETIIGEIQTSKGNKRANLGRNNTAEVVAT